MLDSEAQEKGGAWELASVDCWSAGAREPTGATHRDTAESTGGCAGTGNTRTSRQCSTYTGCSHTAEGLGCPPPPPESCSRPGPGHAPALPTCLLRSRERQTRPSSSGDAATPTAGNSPVSRAEARFGESPRLLLTQTQSYQHVGNDHNLHEGHSGWHRLSQHFSGEMKQFSSCYRLLLA